MPAVTQFSVKLITERLTYILVRRGVSANDVDDIIQEAFHRLEKFKQTREVEHPEGFLVRTAVNVMIDMARQRRRANLSELQVDDLDIADHAPGQEDVYASEQRLERLSLGYKALDPVSRLIVIERLEGKRISDIADLHGLSLSTVEKRLAKSLRFLINWMEGW